MQDYFCKVKRCFILFFALFFSLTGFSQLEVKDSSFKKVVGFVNIDMDKQTDNNDKPYAVLKVRTENIDGKQRRELNFQGDANTFFEVEYKDGEVWLYLSYYATYLKISHKELGSVEFWLPYDMEPKCGYELTIVNKKNNGSAQDVYNYLIIKSDHPEASIYIDNQFVGNNEVDVSFKAGEKHSWRIECDHCHNESGEAVIPANKDENVIIEKTLRLRLVDVSISTDNGVDIYVDDEKKGTGSWRGQITDGHHILESRKASHKSGVKEVMLVYGKDESFVLPTPTPIYGSVDVVSDPSGANIIIDGKNYGKTPMTVTNILIGAHELKVGTDDCSPLVKTITVEENKVLTLNEKLPTTLSFTVNDVSFEMVPVKGGTYKKGKNKVNTTVGDYYIGKLEVTQKLWRTVMGNDPSTHNSGDSFPVENVSWDMVQQFITKLNELTGQNFRLPSDGEWEYAAKGGNKSEKHKYSGGDKLDEVGWYVENSGGYGMGVNAKNGKEHIVGTKNPNELGIYDMSGNVAEWCQDTFKQGSMNRVFRGGSYDDEEKRCTVESRSGVSPNTRMMQVGFRLAKNK